MVRYIDAEKATTHIQNIMTRIQKEQDVLYRADRYWKLEAARDFIIEAPTEDVAPVVHSNWRAENNPSYSPFDPTMDDEVYFCNNCNNKQYKMSNYCPECGAKMDKREKENNE